MQGAGRDKTHETNSRGGLSAYRDDPTQIKCPSHLHLIEEAGILGALTTALCIALHSSGRDESAATGYGRRKARGVDARDAFARLFKAVRSLTPQRAPEVGEGCLMYGHDTTAYRCWCAATVRSSS